MRTGLAFQEGAVSTDCPQMVGKRVFSVSESERPVGSLPLGFLPCRRRHKVFPNTVQGLDTTNDVAHATQGVGVPDHQVLPIGGAQHLQALYLLGKGKGGLAVGRGQGASLGVNVPMHARAKGGGYHG